MITISNPEIAAFGINITFYDHDNFESWDDCIPFRFLYETEKWDVNQAWINNFNLIIEVIDIENNIKEIEFTPEQLLEMA